jgi:hypothetical protein
VRENAYGTLRLENNCIVYWSQVEGEGFEWKFLKCHDSCTGPASVPAAYSEENRGSTMLNHVHHKKMVSRRLRVPGSSHSLLRCMCTSGTSCGCRLTINVGKTLNHRMENISEHNNSKPFFKLLKCLVGTLEG